MTEFQTGGRRGGRLDDRLSPYGERRRRFNLILAAGAVMAAICVGTVRAGADAVSVGPVGAAEMKSKRNGAPIRLLALGDSLTAGWGLPAGDGFVPKLSESLKKLGYNIEIINAGVSGDTTGDGRARLDWALSDNPDAVLIELGANDMLRGIAPGVARSNLDAILKAVTARKLPALLAGMRASPGYGEAYQRNFDDIYPALSSHYGVPLYPFFLEGVATDPSLNQGDGIHPSAAGVAVIVGRITPAVAGLLDRVIEGQSP